MEGWIKTGEEGKEEGFMNKSYSLHSKGLQQSTGNYSAAQQWGQQMPKNQHVRPPVTYWGRLSKGRTRRSRWKAYRREVFSFQLCAEGEKLNRLIFWKRHNYIRNLTNRLTINALHPRQWSKYIKVCSVSGSRGDKWLHFLVWVQKPIYIIFKIYTPS